MLPVQLPPSFARDAPDDSSQWITFDPGELAVAIIDAQSSVSVLDSMAVFVPAIQARRPEQDCDCESQSLPQDLIDFFFVVTAKTQYSLKSAKHYFHEHLSVGDYYQEGQRSGRGNALQRRELPSMAAISEELSGKARDGQPVITDIGVVSASELGNRSGKRA
ncbi:MAG: hypothetical protein DME22_17200 [Verrucomicrobia bacterium]|nr:MAG: hypothetical protein DME22_17200 [Verrucomicrobiota bacterium]